MEVEALEREEYVPRTLIINTIRFSHLLITR